MAEEWIHERKGPHYARTWVVSAPWAHPLWATYAFLLYDLTTPIPGAPAAILYRPDVTHEFLVYALDPAHPPTPPTHILQPANMGYQFTAASNEAAADRIIKLIWEVEARRLSPDTDFRSMWDRIFSDGERLHNR